MNEHSLCNLISLHAGWLMISEGRECRQNLPPLLLFSTSATDFPLEASSAEFLKKNFTSWTSLPENWKEPLALKKGAERERIVAPGSPGCRQQIYGSLGENSIKDIQPAELLAKA